MYKNNILLWIVIFITFCIILKIYVESDSFLLTCDISDINHKKFCAKDRKNIKEAINILATVSDKTEKLVKYLKEKYPNKENVKRLYKKFDPSKIAEISPLSNHVAYSENKGEKLAICLTKDKKNIYDYVDINTIMFVAIHELAHIASETVGHNDEFWNNFKFLLDNAVEIKIYSPVDYKKNNIEYCGMKITDNPYYDM